MATPGPDLSGQRLITVLWLVAGGLALGMVADQLWTAVGLTGQYWRFAEPLPRLKPIGTDYWLGSYLPARELLQSGNPYAAKDGFAYPPLVALLGVPLSLLPYELAYRLQLAGLVGANVLAAVLVGLSFERAVERRAAGQDLGRLWIAALTGLVVLWNLRSYGFLFSLERGNYDAYALLAMALAVWLLVAREAWSPWWSALLIGVAVSLKVYPAILLVLPVWRYRGRSVVPVTVGLIGPLLILGPWNALRFLQAITDFAGQPYVWVGNHSAYSYGVLTAGRWGVAPRAAGYLLLVPPLAAWLAGTVLLLRRGWSAAGALQQLALAIPVMCLAPAVSHDYKLVLAAPAVLLLLLGFGERYARLGIRLDLAAIVAVLFAATIVAMSFASFAGVPLSAQRVLANKYPVLVALEALALLLVLRSAPPRGQPRPAA